MTEDGKSKWISQETKRMAIQKAKDKANAVKWNLDVAVFSFGVLTIVVILSFERANFWITASVAILGLIMVWLLGWRRSRQVYAGFLAEELAQCPDDWKDYYKILRIGPSAEFQTITEAYEQLSHLFDETLADEAKRMPMYSQMMKEADEAYQVLSNPISRTAYDRVFWWKYNTTSTVISESAKLELIDLSQSIASKLSEVVREIIWKIPLVDKITRPMVIGALALLLSILLAGTSFAFAEPGHPLAVPFRGVAITLTKASGSTASLIEDIRGITAIFERQVVSTALQSMRIEETLKEIPAVTVPTNDMAQFPSQEHPLFPDYLDRRLSQFKYTVDSKGIISVDTSWAITDAFLNKIEQTLDRLEKENGGEQ